MQVDFIDKMGDDLAVVNAARVSFDKESEWEYDLKRNLHAGIPDTHYETNPHLSKKDQGLITYLAREGHWTPFSHVIVKMRETVPIFVARQRFKHMIGFSYNEVSRRYVSGAPEFYVPDAWRKAAENKKQGSSDEIVEKLYDHINGEEYGPISAAYDSIINSAVALYEDLLHSGVCPEQARMVLPQSMYTSYIVTGSLAAWARAYKLRIDPHAQKEIQDLATQWGKIIEGIPEMQHSWKALTQ